MRTVVWILALLPGALACGGGASGSGDGGIDASPAEDAGDASATDAASHLSPEERFLHAYERARCEHELRCAHSQRPLGPVAERCHPELTPPEMSRVRSLLEEGHLALDAEAAEVCLASLAAEPCGLDLYGLVLEGPCSAVLIAEADERCVRDEPVGCASGLYCDQRPADPTPGICRPMSALGEACDTYLACPGDDAFCVDGVCRAGARVGDTCTTTDDCYPTLYCVDGACAEAAVGMPCEPRTCGRSLRCVEGSCAPRLEEGEPCEDALEDCEAGTICLDAGVCESDDGHDVGDVCYYVRWYGDDTCLGDLVCRIEELDASHPYGHCVVGNGPGEPCSANAPCEKGSCCTEGRCVSLEMPEAACASGTACPPTHGCTDGRCQPLPVPGMVCDEEIGCLQGRCLDGVCCIAPAGTPCDESTDEAPYGICGGWCGFDGTCVSTRECDAACDGHACWRTADRCGPVC